MAIRSPRRLLVAGSVLTALGCGSSDRAPPGPTAQLGAALQALLDSALAANPQVPSLILGIDAPGIGFHWTGAAGPADRASGQAVTPDATFRIASNTKTYIATAMLKLVEAGRIGLDDPIARHLSAASVATLKGGGYDPTAITIRQLLQHTSGLFDYAMSPQYFAAVEGDFGHRWTRAEQLAFAVRYGTPYGKPGEVFHYSDTGYILLGEVLEQVTGTPMGTAVRDLIDFDRLGIRHTYFESLDSVPAGTPPRVHQYLDTTDTYQLDPSHDLYGGGGLVSTVEDMMRFYRALVRGEIVGAELLREMLEPSPPSLAERPTGYGMGIGAGTMAGVECHGHSGFWGTVARHCRDADLTVAASMNRSPDSTFTADRVARAAVALVLPLLTDTTAAR